MPPIETPHVGGVLRMRPCPRCNKRLSEPKRYCRECQQKASKESLARNQGKPCNRCGGQRVANSSLCQECRNESYRKAKSRNLHKPCAQCGVRSRVSGSYCSACEREKQLRAQVNRDWSNELCACGRGNKSRKHSWCKECRREWAAKLAGTPCKCGRGPIVKGGNVCATCGQEVTKTWRLNDPEAARLSAWRGSIKHKYGLALEEYETLVAHPCNLCGTGARQRFCDHDHATGQVRGALCQPCNTVLYSIEKLGWVEAARMYLAQDPLPLSYLSLRPGYKNGVIGEGMRAQPCAICGEAERRRVIDHCYVTKLARGTLCYRCNSHLHWVEHRPEWVKTAIAYLEAAKEQEYVAV